MWIGAGFGGPRKRLNGAFGLSFASRLVDDEILISFETKIAQIETLNVRFAKVQLNSSRLSIAMFDRRAAQETLFRETQSRTKTVVGQILSGIVFCECLALIERARDVRLSELFCTSFSADPSNDGTYAPGDKPLPNSPVKLNGLPASSGSNITTTRVARAATPECVTYGETITNSTGGFNFIFPLGTFPPGVTLWISINGCSPITNIPIDASGNFVSNEAEVPVPVTTTTAAAPKATVTGRVFYDVDGNSVYASPPDIPYGPSPIYLIEKIATGTGPCST